GDEAIPLHGETPGTFGPARDPHPGTDADRRRGDGGSLEEPEQAATHEVEPVVGSVDGERLTQTAPAPPEPPGLARSAAPGPPPPPPERPGRGEEHAAPFPGRAGDDVHAVMHAVGEVHVRMAGRSE